MGRRRTLPIRLMTSIAQEPPHVLCADDDQVCLKLHASILRWGGYEADTAKDGKEAFDRIVAAPAHFACVISDHQMPEMTGLELARRLRASSVTVPIIVASSSLGEELQTEYCTLSAVRTISKPVDPIRLLELISDLMAKRSSAS